MVLLFIIACITYSTYAADDTIALMLRNSNSPNRAEIINLNNTQANGLEEGDGILPIIGRSVQLVASCVCLAGCLGFFYVEEYATETTCSLLQKISVMREHSSEEKNKRE